jgi:hypothetical protein
MYSYLVSANTNRKEKQQALDKAKEVVESSKSRLLSVSEESNLSAVLLQRQREYRAIVEKKLYKTANTTLALQAKLLSIETRWKQTTKEMLDMARRRDNEETVPLIGDDSPGDAFPHGA